MLHTQKSQAMPAFFPLVVCDLKLPRESHKTPWGWVWSGTWLQAMSPGHAKALPDDADAPFDLIERSVRTPSICSTSPQSDGWVAKLPVLVVRPSQNLAIPRPPGWWCNSKCHAVIIGWHLHLFTHLFVPTSIISYCDSIQPCMAKGWTMSHHKRLITNGIGCTVGGRCTNIFSNIECSMLVMWAWELWGVVVIWQVMLSEYSSN